MNQGLRAAFSAPPTIARVTVSSFHSGVVSGLFPGVEPGVSISGLGQKPLGESCGVSLAMGAPTGDPP